MTYLARLIDEKGVIKIFQVEAKDLNEADKIARIHLEVKFGENPNLLQKDVLKQRSSDEIFKFFGIAL